MRALDLEPDLIELLVAGVRGLKFEAIDIAQQAADTGSPEVADRLDHFVQKICRIQAIPEAMASRHERSAGTHPNFSSSASPPETRKEK